MGLLAKVEFDIDFVAFFWLMCLITFFLFFKGNLYTSGEIGKADLAKAAKYFTKAAEKGWFFYILLREEIKRKKLMRGMNKANLEIEISPNEQKYLKLFHTGNRYLVRIK